MRRPAKRVLRLALDSNAVRLPPRRAADWFRDPTDPLPGGGDSDRAPRGWEAGRYGAGWPNDRNPGSDNNTSPVARIPTAATRNDDSTP